MKGNKNSGTIQPQGKEVYRFVLNFIDDYSGIIVLYFLKHKSDGLFATKKDLSCKMFKDE